MEEYSLQDVKTTFTDVFPLQDDAIIDVILAITLGAKMNGDPIWLMIIGGSSTGKSELVQMIDDVEFVYPVSNLSENTFLSGMSSTKGEEMSLLRQIGPRGMITMKDYTSILTMKADKREVIMGQMREIYDGRIDKKTGNGNSVSWEGKLNYIGAVTDSIYLKEGESAGMGRRAVNYIMPDLDDEQRLSVGRAAQKNLNDAPEKRKHIKEVAKDFIERKLATVPRDLPDIPEEVSESLLQLSNFVTRARTPVERDFRDRPTMVHSLEGLMRMSQQMQKLAQYFMWLNDGKLNEKSLNVLYKICLDSIPARLFTVLKVLAKYKAVQTKGAAQLLNRTTDWTRRWLEDLNMLEVCFRSSERVLGPDEWVIHEPYRQLLIKYGGVVPTDETLSGGESDNSLYYDVEDIEEGVLKEFEENQDSFFDSL